MKKLVLTILLTILSATPLLAGTLEGRLLQSLQLDQPALDLAISPDGQQVFVLQQKQLSLYKIQGELLGVYPLEKPATRIRAQGPNLVLLFSDDDKQVDYLYLEMVYDIDTTGAPVRGPADAPVTIVVYDDFQCPYCAQLAPVLKQVEGLYPKRVKVVFKSFPLPMHQNARPANLAALAAERQGKFWEYHDQLFANYNRLGEAKLTEIAKGLPLDLGQFDKDRKDPALEARIEADSKEGAGLGVNGTPAVFINGRRLQDRSINGFRRMIEAQLQMQKLD